MFLQVVEYLEHHKLLHPNHHGFQANHSVTTTILQLYDTWMDALNNGELVGLNLVDLSAAFDCVDVDLLLAKTEIYKFSRHTRQWLLSSMVGRLQVGGGGLPVLHPAGGGHRRAAGQHPGAHVVHTLHR